MMNPLHATKTVEYKAQRMDNSATRTALNLPNFLTVSRILLVPVFIAVFSTPTVWRSWTAAAVFGTAALTDWLDGYLARKRSEITTIGKLLDPIADKLLVISGLVLLVQFQRVAAWLAIVLIGREIAVTGIRAIAATDGTVISAGTLGKFKVILQIIGILLLILQDMLFFHPSSIHLLGTSILYLAMVSSLVSGIQYFLHVYRHLHTHSTE